MKRPEIIDMFFFITPEEMKILTFKYGNMQKVKEFLNSATEKILKIECEKITQSDEYELKGDT